jgi:hypothetical protein
MDRESKSPQERGGAALYRSEEALPFRPKKRKKNEKTVNEKTVVKKNFTGL